MNKVINMASRYNRCLNTRTRIPSVSCCFCDLIINNHINHTIESYQRIFQINFMANNEHGKQSIDILGKESIYTHCIEFCKIRVTFPENNKRYFFSIKLRYNKSNHLQSIRTAPSLGTALDIVIFLKISLS